MTGRGTRARAGCFTTGSLLIAELCHIDLNRHELDVTCVTGSYGSHDGGVNLSRDSDC